MSEVKGERRRLMIINDYCHSCHVTRMHCYLRSDGWASLVEAH